MIVLSGAELVLPDRILSPGTLVDRRRPHRRHPAGRRVQAGALAFAFHGHYIVPGFIDVHVHGVDGVDSLDDGDAIAAMPARLPRYGVTGVLPDDRRVLRPAALRRVLAQVAGARASRSREARECCPHTSKATSSTRSIEARSRAACLRAPRARAGRMGKQGRQGRRERRRRRGGATFDGGEILRGDRARGA